MVFMLHAFCDIHFISDISMTFYLVYPLKVNAQIFIMFCFKIDAFRMVLTHTCMCACVVLLFNAFIGNYHKYVYIES